MLEFFRNIFSPPRHMILLVIAAWIGLSLAEKRAERHGIHKDDLNNVIFYGLVAFILGGRISFVLQNLPTFLKSPIGIVSINPDIFDAFGGLAAALIAAFIFGQRRELALWPTLDALTPFLAILSIGMGLAHLAAGTAFGKVTDVAWGINLWSATRHPTQVYETLASLLIFGLIWFKKHDPRPGILFLTFAALTAAAQLFLQAFRGDSTLILNSLRQEQVIAWLVLAICFIFIETRFKSLPKAETDSAAIHVK
ncbi:prolipoprotein diacylglyceryl transferase family protein [Candidatus Villigracilis affinis]|uniref:prolipoprotein diacylglyceryl transferase family protein n=1 Tax=Candidatus Villigracilis affinis TaxID=3140682 RepID=UPI001D7912AD|nr:prolipoprotein diacylglyceryl transferase [Anaerolineales bacterium]